MMVRVQHHPLHRNPFGGLLNLEREIDNLLNRFEQGAPVRGTACAPAIDLAEYENESVVIAELPGVRKEDVKISIQDGTLTISGERKPVGIPEDAKWVRNEIATGRFDRVLGLPHDVKTDAVSASLTDGVLRIVLPKAEEARPREISVK